MGEQRQFSDTERAHGEAVLVVLGLVAAGIVWLIWSFWPALWVFVGFGVLTALLTPRGKRQVSSDE